VKNLKLVILMLLVSLNAFASESYYIEGYLPHPRMPELRLKKAYLLVTDGKIVKKSDKPFATDPDIKRLSEAQIGRVLISPGFIDLHGHLKYHGLPIWEEAKGQFRNRFEWRALSSYKKAVSEIMSNPDFGSSSDLNSNLCKSVHYAEMKALIGGTTTVQGIGSDQGCTKDILARNVEIESDFNEESDVRVSTDLFTPSISKMFHEMVFPKMIETGKNFDEAYTSLNEQEKSVMAESSQKRFLDLRSSYLNYLDQLIPLKKIRSFIVHLSEGRKEDSYNKLEYKLAQKIGFAKEGLVIIHGVGLDQQDWKDAASKKMSFVWSPYSNLLLYKETLDVETALSLGVNVSLGADWSPTGSKNLLEEVKIAKKYLKLKNIQSVSDRKLFEMMTINPAKAVKLDDRIGLIEENYMADIVLIKMDTMNKNYYSQVIDADPSDIRAVFVKGRPVLSLDIFFKDQKMDHLLNTDSVLKKEDQNDICKSYSRHVFINQMFTVNEITGSLKNLIPNLDDYLTCRDQVYQKKTADFFATDLKTPQPWKIDSHDSDFIKMSEQLNRLPN